MSKEIEHLTFIRQKLITEFDAMTETEFQQKPSHEKWSAAEIVDHLVKMEKTIAENIRKEKENPSSKKAWKKPIGITKNRLLKVKAPSYTEPQHVLTSKDKAIQALHTSRNTLLDVYESTAPETLESKSFKHPIFGHVPLYQWFPFVGLHEERHLKQLIEVKKFLRKA
ncbi:DinB family protein [Paenisporosarcina cavernae]|uniref:DinB family protein n=1 Tax=Paenisporosarcina cavernae TaxID=2320858 RepID=A0A385YUX1_9BACL|nr:DinB family protein [Paenisporosarcina cavernae]AYC29488.1 DinB family protein [Paenisporosarcina cavernae]